MASKMQMRRTLIVVELRVVRPARRDFSVRVLLTA